ncbi:DUF402 domain-containing protein [Kribbella italica]|uniref:DUF402 domain-containing protein n=1 Tax=Kribbella italica TaxID=1540520 RepID=A0A7W9MUW4_9ACTN|nr:hypothetical protein [Kribbella italica]
MTLEEVTVLHRTGQWCPGVRTTNNAIAYDVPILPQYQAPGRPTTDRCFVLPDEGVQLTKPNTFTGSYEGGWYIDLIETEEPEPQRFVIHDLYVDLLIPPRAVRYDVLDLDEFAEALQIGAIDIATAVKVLRDTQLFIDRHLRTPNEAHPTAWPDFPPAALLPLLELPAFG